MMESITCALEVSQDMAMAFIGLQEKAISDAITAKGLDPFTAALHNRASMLYTNQGKEALFVDGIPVLEFGPIVMTQSIEGDTIKIVATRSVERVKHG